MFLRDGQFSNVIKLPVGSGGVTKGDLCVWSSDKVIKAAAGDKTGDVVGIALETALENAEASFEIADTRIITAPYAGTASNLAKGKVYDITDADNVNIDDVADGCCLCVGYNTDKTTLDFIVIAAARFI
jgi:hypothetical protein